MAGKMESTYRDFSQVSETGEIDGAPSSCVKSKPQTPTQLAEDSFPMKLHYVLEELEKDGLSDVAGWAPNGRCFTVYRQDDFVENVLCQ
jgi:hypothetical protein